MSFLISALVFVANWAAADDVVSKLRVPSGFQVRLYQDDLKDARSLALGDKGTLFVGTRDEGKVYALKDGRVFTILKGLKSANGVAFHKGALFVGEINRLWRLDGIEDSLSQPPKPILIKDDLPTDRHHGWKYIAVGPDQKLYVAVGAPCNVCEKEDPRYAALLRMDLNGKNTEVWASGIRNTVGFDWDPSTRDLWFSDNGRDLMGDDIPPCEINHLTVKGQHFGFPYCHGGEILDPAFGKGKNCRDYVAPLVKVPAHSAPLGIRFYRGSSFPSDYRRGIFVAEHGSWNRSKKIGYRVAFAKLDAQGKVLSYEPFLDGFLTKNEEVLGRPVDVLNLPDGSLLVSDDHRGRLYQVFATQQGQK